MREDHKFVKFALESWGEHKRRSFSALGFPKSSPAFDASNYEYSYGPEPNWKRKRIPVEDECRYRQMRQMSSKPSMSSKIPNYIGNTAMNHVDTIVSELPKIYQEVAEKKFIYQMKDREIAENVCRTVVAIEKRVLKLYKKIDGKLDRNYFRRKP